MDERNWKHPNDVLSSLNAMRERSELTDVVLEVEGRSFPCHRAVLACCSQYFHTMFTSGYAEAKQGHISIKDVTQDAMATILDYAYIGHVKTEPDQIQAVMSAARLLQVDFVFREAANYMRDYLDVSNCADILMYADMLGDLALQEASGRYMASRFQEVALQPSFVQLSLAQLQAVLNRDDLMALSEDDIVRAALRWVEFDPENRQQHLPELCKSFRHVFISSETCRELESRCLSREYSTNTTQRLGQVRKETLIFVKEKFADVYSRCAPCYDPLSTDIKSMNLPDQLSGFSIASTPVDELYLGGGFRDGSKNDLAVTEGKKEKAFFKYNHVLNTWDPKCEMISPRVRCGLVYHNGFIYAIGGDETKKAAERYDPSCDKWTSLPPIPYPVSTDICAVALDDSIYVISKEGCYHLSESENMWSKFADMVLPPKIPQAVTYQGCIYCVDRDGCSTYIEMYNPNDDVWKQSGDEIFFSCEDMILMVYGGSLYILALDRDNPPRDPWGFSTKKIYLCKYQPETKSWMKVKSWREPGTSLMYIGPVVDLWSVRKCRTDMLVARMIPSCLEATDDYYDFEQDSDETDDDTSRSGSSDIRDADR